ERFFDPAGGGRSAEAEIDEAFVDFTLVLDERDLQILAIEPAAQRLERCACGLIRRIGARAIARACERMALKQARVIREDRALDLRQLRQRVVAPSPAVRRIV